MVHFINRTTNVQTSNIIKQFVLMRHMNRAPLIRYKNNTNNIVWAHGLGELTDQGIWNSYRVGQALRERYLGFLHPLQRYTPSEIDVSTTEVDRCYQTAGYLLAGMYPPNEEQTWNKDLKWQPIPIKTSLSKDHQKFSNDPRLCPKYAMELHEKCENIMKTENVKTFISYLKNHTSNPLTTTFEVLKLVDAIYTERMANYSIPNWAMERYQDFENFLLLCMTVLVETNQMKRLYSGEMLNDVLQRMEASIKKSSEAKKIYLHIGHDSTIVPFLKTLNIENITYPFYGASVIMELYATAANETILKLLYNRDYEWKDSKIELIELPGCPQPCRLEDWRTLTQQMIPRNLSDECKN
ncbi:lysosomal acid phosphatase-like isoform X2 [Sipha flava]|uniref:acid phosphatase n=1 Tax=Sipha flava TaxID=143950 RepID=A0A8B8FP74_9HEMI|nr:lysosomal acid phosphatase-like isoform X2 [Sipha flava]